MTTAAPIQATTGNTLENIIDAIVKHDEEHPEHGVGCACHDRHAQAMKLVMRARLEGRGKSMANLLAVIGYLARTP